MAVTLNKANLVLKDANGNIGKIEQLSSNDLAKIKTAVSDVALVVNQSNHTPIEATTTNKGVVQLATSVDVASGAIDKVVTAEQLHNATTGTSALAAENLARIDAVVTEAGINGGHSLLLVPTVANSFYFRKQDTLCCPDFPLATCSGKRQYQGTAFVCKDNK